MSPAEEIQDAIQEVLVAADAANNTTSSLNNIVQRYYPHLISDTTIVKETATLLLHVAQNYSRVAAATLDNKQSKKEARHDS